MCSTVLSLAAGLPHGLRQGQAVLVLSTEEYSHRVLSKALLLRQEKASGIQRGFRVLGSGYSLRGTGACS